MRNSPNLGPHQVVSSSLRVQFIRTGARERESVSEHRGSGGARSLALSPALSLINHDDSRDGDGGGD